MTLGHGARFTLRLVESGPVVVYRALVELPDSTLHGSMQVSVSTGTVEANFEAELPGWLDSTMRGLLRSLWRARCGPGSAAEWPRRLTRWRGSAEAEAP